MRRRNDYLFSGQGYFDFKAKQEYQLRLEVERHGEESFQHNTDDDMVAHFASRFCVEAPEILEDSIEIIQGEADVQVQDIYRRRTWNDTGVTIVKGTSVSFHVPFVGDSSLFSIKPSTTNMNPPAAVVGNDEIVFDYRFASATSEQIKEKFENDLSNLKQYLGWLANDLSSYNNSMMADIRTLVSSRSAKLKKDTELVENLGYTIRRRSNAPRTYTVPKVRKKVPVLAKRPAGGRTQDPSISSEVYEHILSVVTNMTKVMEYSPRAFMSLGEEALRFHFLVQLNGQYEGTATGETFNFKGKTDILIRHENKNLFIAECKIWSGPKKFVETIDQLLDYVSWRDTKTAIIIFNRNKDFSAVLKQISALVSKHDCYIHSVPVDGETNFRYVFRNKEDADRQLLLTVLAFDVPS